jgi:hypothetical protein
MSIVEQRRKERRLRYHWPIWFAEPWDRDNVIQGQIVDLSGEAAAFTCHRQHHSPYLSEQVIARFCVPVYGEEASFKVRDFIRTGYISRVDWMNPHLQRVVIRFHESLEFKPGEQENEAAAVSERLEPALV